MMSGSEARSTRQRTGTTESLTVDALDATRSGQGDAILTGDQKLIPLPEEFRARSVAVTLISDLAVPPSIARPFLLVVFASECIDLAEDERFFRADTSRSEQARFMSPDQRACLILCRNAFSPTFCEAADPSA
jgi:hypothetical protein